MRLRTFCMGCGAMSLVLGCKDKGDTGPAGRFAAMGQLIDNDGAMAIVGGAVSTTAQGPLRETWRLSLRDWTWSKGPTPPFATCRGITARMGDELHIFGGSTTGWDEHAAHWRWQTADGEISTEVDDGPGPRFKHASAVDDDGARFFVLGGRNNDTGEDVYFADLWSWTEAQGWTLLPTTGGPHGLHRHVMVWDPDRRLLWVHAGFQPPREDPGGEPVRSDRLWTLDPATGDWTEQAWTGDGPPIRASHSVSLVDDRLVVWGGSAGDDSTWTYALADSTWTEHPHDLAPLSRDAMVTDVTGDGRTLVFVGGDPVSEDVPNFVMDAWTLDLDTLEWTEHIPIGG